MSKFAVGDKVKFRRSVKAFYKYNGVQLTQSAYSNIRHHGGIVDDTYMHSVKVKSMVNGEVYCSVIGDNALCLESDAGESDDMALVPELKDNIEVGSMVALNDLNPKCRMYGGCYFSKATRDAMRGKSAKVLEVSGTSCRVSVNDSDYIVWISKQLLKRVDTISKPDPEMTHIPAESESADDSGTENCLIIDEITTMFGLQVAIDYCLGKAWEFKNDERKYRLYLTKAKELQEAKC